MYKIIKKVFLVFLLVVAYSTLSAQQSSHSLEDRRKFDYYFYEAMNAKSQGDYDAAYDLLNHCLAIDSTIANVYYELGNFYNIIAQKDKAAGYYAKSIALDSGNFYYEMAYGTICLEQKKYEEAIEHFEKLVKKSPDNTELYIYLSQAYRLSDKLPQAINSLDRLEQIVGLNEKISLDKYQLYTLMGKENKAFAEIQKYITKYPNEIKYQILLGNLYMQAGKMDEAYLVYTKAKTIDPEDPYLISSMAEYYEKTNNKVAAESELHNALISPKMDVDTKIAILTQYIGTLYKNNKDTGIVNALFDSLMIQHPQEPKLNMMYGNLLMLQEKKNEARFQFQIFAESNPTNPVGWEQMLSTAFPDSLNLVIDICRSAISYVPNQPQFYFYKGIAEYMENNYQEALTTLKTGLGYVDGNNSSLKSDFYGQIGDLYYREGCKDSAFIAYDKALNLEPNNIGVLNNYSYYLSLEKKDLDKAEKMSARTVKVEPMNPTYLDTYGWVLFQQGAYMMAKIYIENAVKYSEEKGEELSAEVCEHYGDVLYMTDEKEKALEYWQKAKEKASTESDSESRKSKTLEKKIETGKYIPD